jgi:maltoporin
VLQDVTFSYGAFAVDGQPGGQLSPDTYLPQRYALGVRHDFQIRGIRPGKNQEFQLGFQYLQNWSSDRNDSDEAARTSGGWGATARWVWELLGGDNKLVFQYGVGGGTGFGTLARFYYPDFSLMQDASEWRMRVVDVLTIQPLPWLGTQVAFVYQKDKNSTWTAGEWYSAGTRLSVAFTEHAKVLGEVGYDMAKPDNASTQRWLAKATLALAIASAKGFWGRPELRLFYTYATWNKYAQDAHIDTFDLYLIGNKLSAAIAGVQAEAIF